jgi:hypothetical protein
VFRLDSDVAKGLGVPTTQSLDELLDGTVCCVIGGGAFLTAEGAEGWFYSALLRDMASLDRALTERGIPVLGVSLGGSGRAQREDIPPEVWQLMNNPLFRGATVRLPADAEMLNSLGKRVEYFPDIVLTAAGFLDHHEKPNRDQPAEVLVQYHRSLKTSMLFCPAVWLARALGRRISFLHTHLPRHGHAHQELGDRGTATIECQQPLALLSVLARAKVVVASKLHVGVAAVSLGKCFVSLGGRAKTAAFLGTIGRPHFYFPKGQWLRVVRLLLSRKYTDRCERQFALSDLPELKRRAEQHYVFMLAAITECASGARPKPRDH